MNTLSKIGCRAVQLVFRTALPILPYRQPRLLDSLTDVPTLLKQRGVNSILLVADGTVRDLGLTAPLESALAAEQIGFAVYEQRTPNPTIDNVEDALRVYLSSGARAIVAVGGGSAMDCAKVVGARVARPRKRVQQMRGLLRVLRPTPLLIAAPTTAGTGSETTLAAVITDAQTHHKYPINDFALIPDVAVLDASLTLGLPPFVTATTGLDALTHAVEAYIGRSTNRLTRSMAEEAVTAIAKYLRRAVADGSDAEARHGMLRAAYCAGIAFTRSYVGYVHGIAHSLGGQYGIAHGLANAVILPRMLRHDGRACKAKLARLARASGIAPADAGDAQAAERFIRWIEEMNRDFGLPTGFAQIRREDIPRMARHAAQESNPLYPVPVLYDQSELEPIYAQLMEG
ncbi:MAG: iron-containing alcohol dehydrogenase [Clostridiales bacterium]|nr:iron-containing alcohol dehydrogenase [Clostridiales bacterium]